MSRLVTGATPDQHLGQMLAHPIIEFWVELPTHERSQPAAAVRQKVASVRPNHSVGMRAARSSARAVAESGARGKPRKIRDRLMPLDSHSQQQTLRACDLLAQL